MMKYQNSECEVLKDVIGYEGFYMISDKGIRKFAWGFKWTYSTEFWGDSNVSR